jgi:hypothetical protein
LPAAGLVFGYRGSAAANSAANDPRSYLASVWQARDAGTVEGNVVSGEWFVTPGSGTGGLAGFRANRGEGAQVYLDYWFE